MFDLDSIAERLARLGKEPKAASDAPHAAVAAILRAGHRAADPREAGQASADLFFIRRAERAGDPWSGHIAFPGGRHEALDVTLLATAVRETREEVGIDLTRAELVARLPDVPAFTRTKRGTLVVAPFVFVLPGDVPITANGGEVAETMWVPFASLARGEGKGIYTFTWEGKTYDLPCIRIGPEQHVLWGMTYRMLETMLEALVAPGSVPGDTIAGG